MNPSNNAIDYSLFGGTKLEEEEEPALVEMKQAIEPPKQEDYSQFGGKPVKEKAGAVESIRSGLVEGLLGLPALIQKGVNEWSKGLEKAFGIDVPELTEEEENPLAHIISQLPESEGQFNRRLRTAASAFPISVTGGIPGILAGLVGSQAGQTVREVYGKEGKFDEFGLGEAAAIGADIVAGAGAGIGASAARAGRVPVSNVPPVFRNPQTGLQRAVTKNAIHAEKDALEGVINNFGTAQLSEFQQALPGISTNRYTDLTQSSASGLKRQADRMFTQAQLGTISPLNVTPEQGGRALQEAANTTFNTNVLQAERAAYTEASEAAQGLSGQAPRTIEQAKALRADILKNPPTPEQAPVVGFLNNLIESLETTTAAEHVPASKLIGPDGQPLTTARTIPASQSPTTVSANSLVDLVQDANHAVNYGSELRLQSHRLIPIVKTLRQETGQVLAQNSLAAKAYEAANNLHAENAQTWGTRYMRDLRFSENPERIVGKTKLASNMNNFKQGVQDPIMQGIMERLVIEDITQKGSSTSNRAAITNLNPELTPNARNAANQLIDVKDPLTTTGGRAAVRNEILKDAAQSVSTGKRPEKILKMMETPKGYQIVQESLSHSPQGQQVFQSVQRLFVEDLMASALDSNGRIDFRKAQNLMKNSDVRNVVHRIGGDNLVRRFERLHTFSENFQRNLNLYSKPETKNIFTRVFEGAKNAGLLGGLLHAMHMPLEIILGLGAGKAAGSIVKESSKSLTNRALSNPTVVSLLESISNATHPEQIARQLPRLMVELDKYQESESNNN